MADQQQRPLGHPRAHTDRESGRRNEDDLWEDPSRIRFPRQTHHTLVREATPLADAVMVAADDSTCTHTDEGRHNPR